MGIKNLADNYKKLGSKGFMEKWKQGVNQITPMQQTQAQINFTWITLFGLACGIVVSMFNIRTLWWLAIILIAAIGNTTFSLVALVQKKNLLKQMQGGMENGF